jgi:hypothetical protein
MDIDDRPRPIDRTAAERTLDKIAAMLGANTEWNSAADYLEDIATVIGQSKVYPHPVADQNDDALTYWRAVADDYGIGYDDDEDDGPWNWGS